MVSPCKIHSLARPANTPPLRDARIARLARLITVYRKLQATAEPQPHEIAMVEYRFAYLLGQAN